MAAWIPIESPKSQNFAGRDPVTATSYLTGLVEFTRRRPMPESTIADFPARMIPPEEGTTAFIGARLMMSRQRIVVASDDHLVSMPLSAIRDVAMGDGLPSISRGNNTAFSLAYERDGTTRVVTLAASRDHRDRFLESVFRLVLSGTTTRVTDPDGEIEGQSAELTVDSSEITLQLDDGESLTISCQAIQRCTLEHQSADSAKPQVRLAVPTGDGPRTIILHLESARRRNLLGRYITFSGDATPEEDQTRRVLLVDDNPQMIEVLEAFIRRDREDIEITGATSATDGLRIISSGARVDAVVSDYRMPRVDGIAFLKAVRENHPNLPFILFTGKGNEQVIKEAIQAGVTAYVEKRLGGGIHHDLIEHLDAALESTGTSATP